jgi:hypothetical protein
MIRGEFFNGTTKLSEYMTAPHTTQWYTGALGTYTLIARPTDNAAEPTSSSVTIKVIKKPR